MTASPPITPDLHWLHAALTAYDPGMEELTEAERVNKHLFLRLLHTNPRCLWRDDFAPGHITGSVLVSNLDCTRVLLLHHKKLNLWVQFGGHCDGDGDVYTAALREMTEECGITPDSVIGTSAIFDLDIHAIPERGTEPEHLHFDVRFHVRFDDTKPIPGSDENQKYQWFDLDAAEALVPRDHGRWRMFQKLRQIR